MERFISPEVKRSVSPREKTRELTSPEILDGNNTADIMHAPGVCRPSPLSLPRPTDCTRSSVASRSREPAAMTNSFAEDDPVFPARCVHRCDVINFARRPRGGPWSGKSAGGDWAVGAPAAAAAAAQENLFAFPLDDGKSGPDLARVSCRVSCRPRFLGSGTRLRY